LRFSFDLKISIFAAIRSKDLLFQAASRICGVRTKMEVSGFYDDRTGLIKVKIAVTLRAASRDYQVKTKKESGGSRFLFIPDLLLVP